MAEPTKADLLAQIDELTRTLRSRDATIQELAFQVGTMEDNLRASHFREQQLAAGVAEPGEESQ